MTEVQAKKMAAAQKALEYVRPDSTLGVGTGSTVECLIELLGQTRPAAVVSSSQRSSALLEDRGFALAELNDTGDIDVYIDGADEFTERFTLVKGGGGAHTREKILARAARKFVVIADDAKQVDVHGRFPVAVEVVPMARSLVARKLVALGCSPSLREGFTTDEGNVILDCAGLDCTDMLAMETEICSLPGVLDCGLFSRRLADVIVVAGDAGVRVLTR